MSVDLTLTDKGIGTPAATTTSTLAWLGVSSDGNTPGTTASVYEIDAEGQIPPLVGYGPGPEAVAAAVRISKVRQVFVRVNASLAASLSAVTQSGTGPAITLAGSPYDTMNPVLQIVRGGANGVAQFKLALDGAKYGPILDVPTDVAASMVGTVDLTGFNYGSLDTMTLILQPIWAPVGVAYRTVTFASTTSGNFLTQINNALGIAQIVGTASLSGLTYSTLDTLTLIITVGGTTSTVTFASTTSGNFLTQINNALGARATASLSSNHLLITAAAANDTITVAYTGTANTILGFSTTADAKGLSATASLVRGRYLMIAANTAGVKSTLSMSSGTANALLGFTAGSVTGAAATYTIPSTGVVIAFPVGTYVLNETYTWSQVEPRFQPSDFAAAVIALQKAGVAFRDIVMLCRPVDGADTRALADQASSSLSALRNARPKLFAEIIMASSTAIGENQANDADVKAALQGNTDPYVTVVHGDCYMVGTSTVGYFHRPLLWTVAMRAAAYPISSDPGNRELPDLEETSAIAPDGVTLCRNEDQAVVRMESSGFTVARIESRILYITKGVTRGQSPKFMYYAVMRTALELARIVYAGAKIYENADRELSPTGTLLESSAAAIENAMNERIKEALEENLSNWRTGVDRKAIVARTNRLSVTVDAQPRGYFFEVKVDIGVVDVLS